MKEKINFRQLSVIVFYLLVSLKFLALPSLIYSEAKTDSWIVFLLMAIFDVALIWIILYLMKSSNEKSFYDFLKHRFGVVITKIFCICFFAIFMLDILDAITGIDRLLVESFYDRLDWFVFIIPLLIVTSFMAYRGIRNIGRVCEIFVWFIIFGIIFIIVKSLPEFDITFFLPFLSEGVEPVFSGLINHIPWFGTPVALLFFMGEVDFKNEKKSLLWRYILIAVFEVLIFVIVFYGIFATSSATHSFALADLSQISNTAVAIDELSWLAVAIWVIGQILQLVIFIYACAVAIKYVFNISNNWIPIFIIDMLIITYIIVDYETINLEKIFYSPFVVMCEWVVKLGVTAILIIANIIYLKRRKRSEKT